MITPPDFITLPVTPDLIAAGIQYASRGLLYSPSPVEAGRFSQVRQSITQAAVELALLRYLSTQGIPYATLSDTPFTNPQHAGAILGGHRCQVQAQLLTRQHEIDRFQTAPQPFLESRRLVSPPGDLPGTWEADDLVIAAVLTSHVLLSLRETRAAWLDIQPIHLFYPLPLEWVSPRRWTDPGPLSLCSGCSLPITIDLDGLDQDHHPLSESLNLESGEEMEIGGRFYALGSTRIHQVPDGPLALRRPGEAAAIRQTVAIQPRQWANLWLYQAEITLLGYQRHADMHRSPLLKDLQPLTGLLNRIKEWGKTR